MTVAGQRARAGLNRGVRYDGGQIGSAGGIGLFKTVTIQSYNAAMSAITRLHSHAGPLALHRGKLALLIGLALVLALADLWHSELKPP